MKGTFGEVLRIVIALVFAVTALILIWYFQEKISSFFGGLLLEGLKNFVFCVTKLHYLTPGIEC